MNVGTDQCPGEKKLRDFATRHIPGYRPIANLSQDDHRHIDKHVAKCRTCFFFAHDFSQEFEQAELVQCNDGYRRLVPVPERYRNRVLLPS